jgi:hypothetical protein
MAQQSQPHADISVMTLRATRFLLGLVGAALFVLPGAAAQAVPPKTPALTGTTPGSPGVSTEPLVRGFADGVSPLGVHFAKLGGSGTTSANDPGATITIYAGDSECKTPSAVVAEGRADVFESPGIELTTPVATNSLTTFYAKQSDENGVSRCSGGLNYRQVTGPPESPTLTSVDPASPANDNTPYVIGSAPPEATISIYSDPACSGTAVASGSGSEFGEGGIQVSVADNSTTTFYATGSWAGFTSACSSSSMTYQELSQPTEDPPPAGEKPPAEGPAASPGAGALPPPHLQMSPAGRANNNTPLVVGSAAGAATVRIFDNPDCAGAFIAKGPAGQLPAGFPVQVADNTTTRFYGVAFNGAGLPSTCSPTPATYVEDSVPPLTRITLGPGAKTRARKPVFRFTDITEETGTSFECKLDHGAWKACQTPWHAPRLRRRGHVVRIKAIDAAGNAEATAAKRRFKVVAGQSHK